jgi:hypothetical protein
MPARLDLSFFYGIYYTAGGLLIVLGGVIRLWSIT